MEGRSSFSDIFKPIGPAILFVEEILAVGEEALLASRAFGRVGAVEVGDVLVADVAEPVLYILPD